MKNSLIVFLGSGLRGVARYLINGILTTSFGSRFPWGILIINIIGSTALGVVAGWLAYASSASADLRLFLITGILGGYTTFSAFSLDAALMYDHGQRWLATAFVGASLLFSILGVFGGLWSAPSQS